MLFETFRNNICGIRIEGIDEIVIQDGDRAGRPAAQARRIHVDDIAEFFTGGVDLFFHLFRIVRFFVEHARNRVDGEPRLFRNVAQRNFLFVLRHNASPYALDPRRR